MNDADAGRITASFSDFLRTERPDLLPSFVQSGPIEIGHGTTILALRYADGVVIAGDRRGTEGMHIAQTDAEKVYPADSHSAVAIAGAFGPAVEMVRLFQTELEYYEKVEGEALSLPGKANHLARMIRANLPAAMQGFVVVPLFAGYDQRKGEGRIYRFDVTGGASEEDDYYSVGSGGLFAKTSLKKLYAGPASTDRTRAIELAIEALVDAAEEDAATAGPDPVHGLYPTVFVVSASGVEEVAEDEIARIAGVVLEARSRR